MTTNRLHLRDDQFARRVASHLDAACAQLPHDITERLRAARARAVAARPQTQTQLITSTSIQVQANGTAALHFGGDHLNLWGRLAALFPLIGLVAGLVLVNNFLDDDNANELAEVDVALLTDDLPPSAYADPGFLQFLKTPLAATSVDTPTAPN